MLWRLFRPKIYEVLGLFNGHFIEVKALYALLFDDVSCVSFIGEIDTSKAYELITERLKMEIVSIYQHSYFEHKEQGMLFNNTVFVLRHNRIIELGANYCQLLHTPRQYGWAYTLIKEMSAFRIKSEEKAIGFARQTSDN